MNTDIDILCRGDLKNARQPDDWIWDGYIGPRWLTLFVSPCKLGKTTLLAHFLAQRKNGGEFLGQTVRPGASVIISEESAELWDMRDQELGFRDDDRYICRPFAVPPVRERWEALIEKVRALHASTPIDLAIIDPLSQFLPPGAENMPALLIPCLAALRRLTAAGMAVVLVHHPRKASSQAGLSSRGSSLLPSFADIIMELYPGVPEDQNDRRRRILGFSRFSHTPRLRMYELSADGRTCIPMEAPPLIDEFTEHWGILRIVLEDADGALTRQEILDQWPTSYLKPKQHTLWKWLDHARANGLVCIEGNGHRADPFRYFLTEKLEEWKKDPMYELKRMMDASAKDIARALGRKAV